MTPLDQCDEAAATVIRAYKALGLPAFVLCIREDGLVSTICPSLELELVARMLHTAADAYLAQAHKPTIQ